MDVGIAKLRDWSRIVRGSMALQEPPKDSWGRRVLHMRLALPKRLQTARFLRTTLFGPHAPHFTHVVYSTVATKSAHFKMVMFPAKSKHFHMEWQADSPRLTTATADGLATGDGRRASAASEVGARNRRTLGSAPATTAQVLISGFEKVR